MRDILINGLESLNISYTDKMVADVDALYEMLSERNKTVNLTRIIDKAEYYTKHILDSLLIVKTYDPDGKKIMDVGTGAGFPGLPLKIFFPDINIVLLDSVNKKLLFIQDVIDELGLKGATVVHGRAEDLGHDTEYRERFDAVVSRAVADMSVLSEYCIPFSKVGGSFISYKAYDSDSEIDASCNSIRILSGSLPVITGAVIPGTDIERKLVRVDKISETDPCYPRSPKQISKDPLL